MEKTINDIKINVPEGMEAYLEDNIIKFKPSKKLTYKDIAIELFDGKDVWRIVDYSINKYKNTPNWDFYTNCTSEKQAQKIIAIKKLMNVAKYLNAGWQPDWNDNKQKKYYIFIDMDKIKINTMLSIYCSDIYFKSEELAQQAIEILGEETVKLALCTDW